jgi:uncharacterized protein (TIGR02996 family)
MNERQAFIQVIRENPDDDGPRLIYADWLDEQGDPRGEFIRIGCENDRLGHTEAWRNNERWWRHHGEWAGPTLAAIANGRNRDASVYSFRRGFVEIVELNDYELAEHAEALFQENPIREVNVRLFDQGAATMKAIAALPQLSSLRHLGVPSRDYEGDDPHCDYVGVMGRGDGDPPPGPQHTISLCEEAQVALLTCPYLHNLQSLNLSRQPLGDRAAAALAASAHLGRLTRLNLSFTHCGDLVASALAGSPHFSQLTELDLSFAAITDQGARSLSASPYLARLAILTLKGCSLSWAGARVLLESPHLVGLTHLDLAYNQIADGDTGAPVASDPVTHVRTLVIDGNPIMDSGVRALAGCPGVAGLTDLSLDRRDDRLPRVGDEGAKALADSPYLVNLRRLELAHHDLTAEGARALAASPYLRSLVRLNLDDNPIGLEGAEALVSSTRLESLCELFLRVEQIAPERRESLRKRFRGDRLFVWG